MAPSTNAWSCIPKPASIMCFAATVIGPQVNRVFACVHQHSPQRAFVSCWICTSALTPGVCALQPAKFEFYDPQSPIYTSPRFLPPAKIVDCQINDAIISHGAFLEECKVDNSIVGLRSRVGKNVKMVVCVQLFDKCCCNVHPAGCICCTILGSWRRC